MAGERPSSGLFLCLVHGERKILITNNLQKGVFSFRIGILFANLMGRALIIYFCIVWLRVSFGISFLSLGPQLGNA